jgi:hypothetical protein
MGWDGMGETGLAHRQHTALAAERKLALAPREVEDPKSNGEDEQRRKGCWRGRGVGRSY